MAGEKQVVRYGAGEVRIVERGDGRWHLRWRVEGRERSSTATTKARALERGREIAKGLAAGAGSAQVSRADGEALRRLREIAPDGGEMASFVARISGAVSQAGSWEAVERAVAHYRRAGVESIERVTVGVAVERFVTLYEHERARMTAGGVRKELRGFAAEPGRSEMGLAEISREMLKGWIARGNPGARFFNNRRATWKTFLNRCRSWGWWPGGLPTPAEEIERRREPVRAPEILSVQAAAAGLIALRMAQPDLVPYFVLGCWTGLRPTELLRIRWGDFDWEMGHLHVRAEVARKTLLERFVPLEANVIALLRDHADVGRYRRREPESRVCGYKDAQRLSAFLRAEGIVSGWTQDVMRHSYISYRIARGDSLARIAEEAGNSESIIRRRYRRPVRASEGAQWFGIGGSRI